MKKLLIPLLMLCLGCAPEPNVKKPTKKNGDFTIKVIDQCEYIEYEDGIFDQRVYSLTHKGNCKYCAKRNSVGDTITFKKK